MQLFGGDPRKMVRMCPFTAAFGQENSHSQCVYQSYSLSRLRKCYYSFVNPSFLRHQGKGNALISGNRAFLDLQTSSNLKAVVKEEEKK